MLRICWLGMGGLTVCAATLLLVGCTSSTPTAPSSPTAEHDHAPAAPPVTATATERQLYLTPGGVYTQADITANGNVTAAQKFSGFVAAHDLKPEVGDKICPITLTKANQKCSWVVGGKSYEFCCPPCVDEFVGLAKTKPEEVKLPEHYVKGETTAAAAN